MLWLEKLNGSYLQDEWQDRRSHTSGGPRGRPCFGQGSIRRINASGFTEDKLYRFLASHGDSAYKHDLESGNPSRTQADALL